jgi:hypothetical protein
MTGAHDLDEFLAIGQRLAAAIESDIAALQAGRFDRLATADPEIERLAARYTRAIAALKTSGGLKSAPPTMIAKLKELGTRLKPLLARHQNLTGAMRKVSEGLVQAIALEADKMRKRNLPYGQTMPKAAHAPLLYNKVV